MRFLKKEKSRNTDPKVLQILGEIELRARVELAKYAPESV